MASGQCYGCATTFGIFKKEHGCKNCGFSYCSKCVSKIIEVPKLNNARHHVCNRCHQILTGLADREREKQERERQAAPDVYYKRLAALQDRQPGGAHYNYGMHYAYNPAAAKTIPPQYRGLSRIDADIAMRLDKLKESEKGQPKDAERDISNRLYKLKGTKPNPAVTASAGQKVYHPPDRRTQQEQVDDLLNEIADEVEVDAKFDPAKEVEERLSKFKGENSQKPGTKPSGNVSAGSSKLCTKDGDEGNLDEKGLDEVNVLIASVAGEMEVNAWKAMEDLQKDEDIMKKLNEIKGRKQTVKDEKSPVDKSQESDDSEDEELVARKLIKQYLEEVKLEERLGDIPSIDGQPIGTEMKTANPEKCNKTIEKPEAGDKNKTGGSKDPAGDEEFDPDELPYCCLCTNDATIRCLGCDFDLYCAGCFKEAHDKFDMNDHVTVKYVAPKEKNDN